MRSTNSKKTTPRATKIFWNYSLWFCATVVAIVIGVTNRTVGQTAAVPPVDQASTFYDTVHALQANFPIPSPSMIFNVGTIHVNTCTIDYTLPYFEHRQIPQSMWGDEDPVPRHAPGFPHMPGMARALHQITVVGGRVAALNAHDLKLRFLITDWPPGSSKINLTVGANSVAVDPGTSEAIVLATADNSPSIQFSANGKQYPVIADWAKPSPPLQITRIAAGAGAMTIEVLPVTIIYAPPVDAAKKNTAGQINSAASGCQVTFAKSTENSDTTPAPANFQGTDDVVAAISTLSPILKAIGTYDAALGWLKPVSDALGFIASGLGKSTASITEVETQTYQNSLVVATTASEQITASASVGGPGVGDVICYLHNPKVIWFSDGSTVRFALISPGIYAANSIVGLEDALNYLNASP